MATLKGEFPPNLCVVVRTIPKHPKQMSDDGNRLFDQRRFGFIVNDADVCLIQSEQAERYPAQTNPSGAQQSGEEVEKGHTCGHMKWSNSGWALSK